MKSNTKPQKKADKNVGDNGFYQEAEFLELWRTSGTFPGPAAMEARWGMLNAIEQGRLTVMQWNWVSKPTRQFIAWLLAVAKYYLAVSIKFDGRDREGAQRICWKALDMAVKNITQLPFDQDQDLYVELLKFLDNHKIYPEFWKEPYARHVKKFLDMYIRQWDDLKSRWSGWSTRPKQEAVWQEKFQNNRHYWYRAIVMTCNLRSAYVEHDQGMILALKSHLALSIRIVRGKKAEHLTLAGMLKMPDTQLDGKTPIPIGVWSRDLLLRIGRNDGLNDLLFGF